MAAGDLPPCDPGDLAGNVVVGGQRLPWYRSVRCGVALSSTGGSLSVAPLSKLKSVALLGGDPQWTQARRPSAEAASG